MSADSILPPHLQPSAAWSGAFTESELDTIESYGDGLAHRKLDIRDAAKLDHYGSLRISSTAWIDQDAQSAWLYERMAKIAAALNARAYQFNLGGFSEKFNYTVYHGSESGHCDWHVDQDAHQTVRKLSLSLQLSAPSLYEGGELQFYGSNRIETAPKERGTVIAFPSYVLHRVAPVTAGTRKAIIAWCAGPRFV